jgi:hypothetical protein
VLPGLAEPFDRVVARGSEVYQAVVIAAVDITAGSHAHDQVAAGCLTDWGQGRLASPTLIFTYPVAVPAPDSQQSVDHEPVRSSCPGMRVNDRQAAEFGKKGAGRREQGVTVGAQFRVGFLGQGNVPARAPAGRQQALHRQLAEPGKHKHSIASGRIAWRLGYTEDADPRRCHTCP